MDLTATLIHHLHCCTIAPFTRSRNIIINRLAYVREQHTLDDGNKLTNTAYKRPYNDCAHIYIANSRSSQHSQLLKSELCIFL